MDLQSKNNAREALNNLKMEISSELGYYYNMRTDKIEGLAPRYFRWYGRKYKSRC